MILIETIKNTLYGVIIVVLNSIMWIIDIIFKIIQYIIPDITNLPDLSKILGLLNFGIPNLKELLPEALLNLDIGNLLNDFLC